MDLGELITRASTDPEFRAGLAKDPAGAAAAIGLQLSAEDVEALKSAGLLDLGEVLNARVSKWGLSPLGVPGIENITSAEDAGQTTFVNQPIETDSVDTDAPIMHAEAGTIDSDLPAVPIVHDVPANPDPTNPNMVFDTETRTWVDTTVHVNPAFGVDTGAPAAAPAEFSGTGSVDTPAAPSEAGPGEPPGPGWVYDSEVGRYVDMNTYENPDYRGN